jgi:hypothetical protein
MGVAELRERLRTASHPERVRLIGKILREARDTDVWEFTSPEEVLQLWPHLYKHLGRRRRFWEFLFERWRIEGFLAVRSKLGTLQKVFLQAFFKKEKRFFLTGEQSPC